ncbi:hypothetical protein RhiirA4_480841 [Rhizophagus irregularis]|uniref:Uncharacterized protein n=1 Tax=Rhizophagus irregularis TaxID=588596 RepID=A0A2I1HIJ4_9GLOM|nr:hypothetical protein RhiirA4_480841 [Rhizophagus irregularis]
MILPFIFYNLIILRQDKKYSHQWHHRTPPYDRSTENSESFDSKKVSNDNQSHNKNKNEGKDLAALEEEVRYLREVIKQGKLREINEETSSSKKMEQGNSFRTSEEPSQDSNVDNITGLFNLIISEDLLHEKQSTSISFFKPQEKQSTSISSSELQKKQSASIFSKPQEKQSTSTSPSQERQSTSISTSREKQSTFISQEKQNMTLSLRSSVRIQKLHLLPLPFEFNTDSKKMDQKKHHCSESKQEYSDFEQDSDSKDSSDSEKSSYSKQSSSDSKQRPFKFRPSRSQQRSSRSRPSRSRPPKSDQNSQQRSSKSRPPKSDRNSKSQQKSSKSRPSKSRPPKSDQNSQQRSSKSRPPNSKSGQSFSKRRSKSGRKSSSVRQQSHRRTQKYLNIRDMPETLKDALRRELFWIIERIPAENQLDINSTFDSQHNLVTGMIVPTVMAALDSDTYPVTEAIIYDMIHAHHKHQREEHLNKSKFKVHEFEQIKKNSAFHSPEVSETDTENLNEKRNIVIKKLKWRSSTKRTRVYDDDFYEKEQIAPLRSPKWVVGDYQGSLKNEIKKTCYRRTSDSLPQI